MATHKKKIVVLLAMVALVGTAVANRTSKSNTAESQKSLSGNLSDKSASLTAKEPNSPMMTKKSLTNHELFLKMMVSILLVVVLGGLAIYLSRKFGVRIANQPNRKIHVVETTHIGPRKTLHLVKVGNQHLLVGSTADRIVKLADLNDSSEFDKENPQKSNSTFQEDLLRQKTNTN